VKLKFLVWETHKLKTELKITEKLVLRRKIMTGLDTGNLESFCSKFRERCIKFNWTFILEPRESTEARYTGVGAMGFLPVVLSQGQT
jgi:hypothetical protein